MFTTSLVSSLLWWAGIIQISLYHLSLINKWQAQPLCSSQSKIVTTFPGWDWSTIHNHVQHLSIQIFLLLLKDLNKAFSLFWFCILIDNYVNIYPLTLPSGFIPAVDGQMFRSSCLPKQLEAEWHFGGVKYQYGGNKEGKLRRLVASCKISLVFRIWDFSWQMLHQLPCIVKDTCPIIMCTFDRAKAKSESLRVAGLYCPYSGSDLLLQILLV